MPLAWGGGIFGGGGGEGVSGSGASGRLSLWSGAGTLTSDSGLTYSGTGTGTVLRIGSSGTGLSEISAGVIGVGTGAAGSEAGGISAATSSFRGSAASTITYFMAGTPGQALFEVGNHVTLGVYNAVNLAGRFGLGSNGVLGWAATASGTALPDTIVSRRATATLQLGAADSATPVPQTIAFQGSRGGTDTNTAGVDATIQGSLGTGTAASGKLVFKVGTPQATGTTQHVPAAVLTLQDTGTGGTPLPAATFAGSVTISGALRNITSVSNVEPFHVGSSSVVAWGVTTGSGNHHLYPNPTNTRDIGVVGNLIRSVAVATSVVGSQSKVLTDASATDFATIPLADGAMTAGEVIYRVTATEGTEKQVIAGRIRYSAIRKGTTYDADASEVGTQTGSISSGTLTGSVSVAAAAGVLTFSANFDSSLTAPTVTMYYRFDSTDTLAVTGL